MKREVFNILHECLKSRNSSSKQPTMASGETRKIRTNKTPN